MVSFSIKCIVHMHCRNLIEGITLSCGPCCFLCVCLCACMCVVKLFEALPLRHSLATAQPACIIHTEVRQQIVLPQASIAGTLWFPFSIVTGETHILMHMHAQTYNIFLYFYICSYVMQLDWDAEEASCWGELGCGSFSNQREMEKVVGGHKGKLTRLWVDTTANATLVHTHSETKKRTSLDTETHSDALASALLVGGSIALKLVRWPRWGFTAGLTGRTDNGRHTKDYTESVSGIAGSFICRVNLGNYLQTHTDHRDQELALPWWIIFLF